MADLHLEKCRALEGSVSEDTAKGGSREVEGTPVKPKKSLSRRSERSTLTPGFSSPPPFLHVFA